MIILLAIIAVAAIFIAIQVSPSFGELVAILIVGACGLSLIGIVAAIIVAVTYSVN